jgi:translation initiation factor 1
MKRKAKDRVETNPSTRPLTSLAPALAKLPLDKDQRVESEALAALAPVRRETNEPLWKPGRVLLRRETAHRIGKTVVVVYDFATHLPVSVIEKTAKRLRTACGAGGTVKDRTIEIQGDQVAKVRATLEAEGFVVGGIRG